MTPELFWPKVQGGSVDECWEWLAYKNQLGYGRFTVRIKDRAYASLQAHRYAFQLLVAEIPEGLTVDHLCRNTSCVNPWHMDLVPKSVNTARGNAQRAKPPKPLACVQGHPWTEENRYRKKSDGTTMCRPCGLERKRMRRARLAAASA